MSVLNLQWALIDLGFGLGLGLEAGSCTESIVPGIVTSIDAHNDIVQLQHHEQHTVGHLLSPWHGNTNTRGRKQMKSNYFLRISIYFFTIKGTRNFAFQLFFFLTNSSLSPITAVFYTITIRSHSTSPRCRQFFNNASLSQNRRNGQPMHRKIRGGQHIRSSQRTRRRPGN